MNEGTEGGGAAGPARKNGPARRGTALRLAAIGGAMFVAVAVSVVTVTRGEADRREAEPLPVATVRVEAVDSHARVVELTGRLVPRRESAVGFERRGLLTRVRVDDGNAVEEGEVLAQLDTDPLVRRRRELVARKRSTEARLELARRTAERQERLARQGHASEQRYDEARLDVDALSAQVDELDAAIAQIDLDIRKSSLRAPFDGRVQRRHVDEGTVVDAGAPVLTVVEDGHREARVGLPASLADTLEIGGIHTLRVNGPKVDGHLKALTPDLTRDTRTVTAIFEIPNGNRTGKLGDLVRLRLERDVPGQGYWLPRSALSEDIRGLWSVLALHPADVGEGFRLRRESVEVVEIDGDRVFARGTLQAGRRIVADAVDRVTPGQRVVPARRDAEAE